MKNIVWSKVPCGFCEAAKTLLKSKNIEFEERHLSNEVYKKFLVDNGYKTVPQIWNHRGEHIGGYDDLVKYFERTILSETK